MPPSCADCFKIWEPQPPGSLNLLDPSGPVQARNGIELPLPLHFQNHLKLRWQSTSTVEPRFTNLIRSWRPFVIRNVRTPKLCVLSESYKETNALPPILPACRQPLLPACVFVTRDTVRHPRLFFFGKFVREPICS
jgi:hypothetical protein